MVTTSAPTGPRWRWEGGFVVLFLRTFVEEVTGSVEADAEPCFEGCGLGATCGNRGQRTRLQWRLGRRVGVSYACLEGCGLQVPGVEIGKRPNWETAFVRTGLACSGRGWHGN